MIEVDPKEEAELVARSIDVLQNVTGDKTMPKGASPSSINLTRPRMASRTSLKRLHPTILTGTRRPWPATGVLFRLVPG